MRKEAVWTVRRTARVNESPDLIRQFMLVKQGERSLSPQLWLLWDKFRYLRGDLDGASARLTEAMGAKAFTGHPFIPRPDVWHHELMRIVRKAHRETNSFQCQNLAVWEKEYLALGKAFETDALPAGEGLWQHMFRLEMVLKRGKPLKEQDREFHDAVIGRVPQEIRQEFLLE